MRVVRGAAPDAGSKDAVLGLGQGWQIPDAAGGMEAGGQGRLRPCAGSKGGNPGQGFEGRHALE